MRLHRFFVNFLIEHTKTTIKDEKLIHQWRDVFRYNIGSEVILFDGSGNEYDSVIEKMNNREAEVRLVSERKGIVPDKKITLYQSLIKKDKMEWVVEKATELGVYKIIPIISERSEKKSFNLERAKKIAIEASEQCGRADVPVLECIMGLEECIMDERGEKIIFDQTGEPFSFFVIHNTYPISLFVGPEGGWTEKELEMFKNANAKIYSLGKLILRAETAAIVAISKFS
ncbi:MAG: RsmE family RNA methyltransferase [Patescibacteria group bacterium]